MIQKDDDLTNEYNYENPYTNNNQVFDIQFTLNSEVLTQAMSFEDYAPQESTMPSVETVLPQYIPTPPPSLPSPSVNIMNTNTTVPQFQLQHQTPPPQHNQNINNHYYYYEQQQQQHQQVTFHSSPSQFSHTHNNNNIESTLENQLFVDRNTSNDVTKDTLKTSLDISQTPTNNHSIQSQETILDVSDASTVDADEPDNLNDEQFTYLQNLNSDNLMKFSQQSVLQQLMQEQMDIKPNLNLIPTCDEHDYGGYNFQILINSTDKFAQRPGVIFSKETQRLYLKTNENVYIDCFYTQKMPIQPLRVRVFAVFDKDTSDPVLRCQNHISKDNDSNEIVRRSLVRCKNPDAVYYGSDTGKSINDRYSVVVPLNTAIKGNETNQLKQQLIISFSCYNSCMNRKQTAAIFLLEGMNGEILAQRTLPVKISTCPKRDKRLYEGPASNFNKRKHLEEPNFFTCEAKMAKYDESSLKDDYSRSSFEEASDDGITNTIAGSVHHEKETGDFILTLKYKSRQQMLQTIGAIYCNAITNEVLYKTSVNGRRTRESEFIKKLYETTLNLKVRSNPPTISMD